MRAYTANVLPTEAAYYTLQNATLHNSQLHILAGGSASIILTAAQLASLTEFLRVTAVVSPSSDFYEGCIYIVINIISDSGTYFTHYCNVATDTSGVFSTEIEAIAENYAFLQVVITSAVDCTFTEWGLEPEASNTDVTVEIDGVKQAVPRLLYDYNTTNIVVEQQDQVVGRIACYLKANTDLQGHYLINFVASQRCNVYLRFFDNGVTELFSPLMFTINDGWNTLTVPHAYLKKLAGIHDFIVTAQATTGYLTVPIRNILYTIDGGYLATRLLNPGIDIQDFTIAQFPTDESPSAIWAVGIDNDLVIVKHCTYDITQSNLAWTTAFTLGKGLKAAIEFDCHWVRRKGQSYYTMETYDVPYVAIIDTKSNLYVYTNGLTVAPILIDSNVTMLSMCRGYKSDLYPDQDQGMVIAYIKNGNVYYAQYKYILGEFRWINPIALIETGNILNVTVHRLNDYRLGVVTQSATENLWYITPRTYVGTSAGAENLTLDISSSYPLLTILSTSGTLNFAGVAQAIPNTTDTFEVIFDYDIVPRIDVNLFTVKVEVNGATTYIDTEGNTQNYFHDIAINNGHIITHTTKPITSQKYDASSIIITFNKYDFGLRVNDTQLHEPTTVIYNFSVPFVPNYINHSYSENITLTLSKNSTLSVVPVNKINNINTENATFALVKGATLQVCVVNKVNHTANEVFTLGLNKTAVLSCILVGTTPI